MNEHRMPDLPDVMRAARLHAIGSPLSIDEIAVPSPRCDDVLVRVDLCGVVPNMRRVIGNFFGTKTADPKLFPPLPAIFGLDPVGVIAAVGEHVTALRPGDRVYVNPARTCGSCRMCRTGHPLDCPVFSFQGYFARSKRIMAAYPYGGFCQFITAPTSAIVHLPDMMAFADAARLGYLGTAYSALKKIGVGPGANVLINGVSGTLGLCAVLLALAMGARRVLGLARNEELMARVRRLSPDRIHTFAMAENGEASGDDPLRRWALDHTDGAGVDAVLDCLPPGVTSTTLKRSLYCLRRGGQAANVGAVIEHLDYDTFWMMTNRIGLTGSVWFTTAEAEEIVALAADGRLDLSPFDHRTFPLAAINEALSAMDDNRDGGFANYLIDPKDAAAA